MGRERDRVQPVRVSLSPAGLLRGNYLLLLAATLALFASMQVLMPVLPLYVIELGGRARLAGLVIGAFAMGSVVIRPLIGRLLDTRGRVAILRVGAIAFFLSPLLYPICKDTRALLVARLWHGISFGCYMTAASTVAVDLAPERRRGEALGLFNMSSRLPLVLVPIFGAHLLTLRGFLDAFIASAAIALVTVMGSTRLREPAIDRDWQREGRSSYRELLTRYSVVSSLVAVLGISIPFGVINAFLPILAQIKGIANSGWLFSSAAVASILVMIYVGRLSDRIGQRPLIVPGLLLVVAGLWAFVRLQGRLLMLFAAGIYGAGFGAVQVLSNALVVDGVSIGDRGKSMSIYTALFDLGIFFGGTIFGYLFGDDALELFYVAGLVCLAWMLLYLFQTSVMKPRHQDRRQG